jgi:hypothetical protein
MKANPTPKWRFAGDEVQAANRYRERFHVEPPTPSRVFGVLCYDLPKDAEAQPMILQEDDDATGRA